jgi:hypothetical protein
MTKSVAKTAALAALGIFAFSGLVLSAYAAAQGSDEPDLLGGPGGPPVGRSRPQAPVQNQIQPKPAPLAPPSIRAPLQPRVDAPSRAGAPDVSPLGVNDASPLVENDEGARPPIVQAYANHATPDDHDVADAAPTDDLPAPPQDFAQSAPREYAQDNGADRSIEDSGEFTRLEREIERATRTGRIRSGAAVNLYAELDDIHDQREYYRRTRGTLGPQEIAAVLRRLDALDARLQQAENTVPYRSRYRY